MEIKNDSVAARLVIHGGAGDWNPLELNDSRRAAYEEVLRWALLAGSSVLASGGSALDAVLAAVVTLEDSELYNAGRGSVLNSRGEVEMDAAIMDGETLAAGAVAGVTLVKNPILLAREIMEHSPHVLLAGAGALAFARERELRLEAADYFITDSRKAQWEQVHAAGGQSLDHDTDTRGTVGAVALDARGNLAAATSTGGMVNKALGRIGDSPVIGAGTYAANGLCAVSCTGVGEAFLRAVVAHDLAARMRYANTDPARAARGALESARTLGGKGGLIALGADGTIATPANTNVMFRGFVIVGDEPRTFSFAD